MDSNLDIFTDVLDQSNLKLLDFAPVPILIHANGIILYVNDHVLDLFAVTNPDKLIGNSLVDYIAPSDVNRIKDRIKLQTEGKEFNNSFIFKIIDDHDSVKDIEIKSSRIKFKDQPAFLVIAQNITRRKQLEQELIEKNLLIEKITQTVPDIIYVTDLSTNDSIFENYNLIEWLGFDKENLPTDKWSFLFSRLHPEDVEKVAASGKELKNSKDDTGYVETEYRLKDSEDNWRWIYSRSRVFKRAEDGSPLQNFGIAQDITDLKIARQELGYKVEELSEKNIQLEKYITSNLELEKYAYIASHDLKEPLRTIVGFSQLLEKRYKNQLDEEADDFIKHIISGTKRMEVLVEGLLAYSRVESKGQPFEMTSFDELLDKVVLDLRNQIEESGAEVRFSDLPVVHCDQLQMRQLIQNLISNSIKFRGDEPLKISIDSVRENGQFKFSVSDNGIGLDMNYHTRIFQIFQRLHTQDKYPGAGIGLSICKRIIDRHNGAIWVESEPGKGTTFFFSIPETKINEDPSS